MITMMQTRRSLITKSIAAAFVSAGATSVAPGSSFATNSQHPGGLKPYGEGTLNKIDAAKRILNITHGPIMALNWPGMTMNFGVAPGVDIGALKPGAKIVFTLTRGADGKYVVDEVKQGD